MKYFVVFLFAFVVLLTIPILTLHSFEMETNFDDLDSNQFMFNHTIYGGYVEKMYRSNNESSVFIEIKPETNGSITVDIPKFLVNAYDEQCNDASLVTLLDNMPIPYIESNHREEFRSITMNFTTPTMKLTIIGTSALPVTELGCNTHEIIPKFLNMSPQKQSQYGVAKNNIVCNDNLILIQKYDGSPACVKPETKLKLIERGWASEETENILSSKYTVFEDVEKLLSENKIDYLPDKLVVTSGISIRGDSGCGAVVDSDSQTHWFGIDSISNPTKMTLYSENPQQCIVNTNSCFCNAQIELASLTIDELIYFTPAEEEEYSEILIDYLYDQNINRTPKFQIGKLNINYTDSDAIGYCGHIWGTNTRGFFSGAIVNDIVEDYGIDKELPLLCAISENAKWWENEN